MNNNQGKKDLLSLGTCWVCVLTYWYGLLSETRMHGSSEPPHHLFDPLVYLHWASYSSPFLKLNLVALWVATLFMAHYFHNHHHLPLPEKGRNISLSKQWDALTSLVRVFSPRELRTASVPLKRKVTFIIHFLFFTVCPSFALFVFFSISLLYRLHPNYPDCIHVIFP